MTFEIPLQNCVHFPYLMIMRTVVVGSLENSGSSYILQTKYLGIKKAETKYHLQKAKAKDLKLKLKTKLRT